MITGANQPICYNTDISKLPNFPHFPHVNICIFLAKI